MRWILKSFLFLFLGLLPLWVALCLLAVDLPTTYGEREYEGWSLVLLVALGCPVTLFVTAAGFAGYHVPAGGRQRKAATAAASAFVATLFVALVFGAWSYHRKELEASNEEVEARVLSFVEADPSVRRFAGGTPKYHDSGMYLEHAGQRIEYTVLVEGTAHIRAIVEVRHDTRPATLRLACVTPMDHNFMDSRDDRCARAADMMRALDFARADPSTRAAAGEGAVFTLVGEKKLADGRFEYHVEARGTSTVYAVVRTSSSEAAHGLELACVSRERRMPTGFLTDPCAEGSTGSG